MKELYVFILINILLIFGVFYISFRTHLYMLKKKGKPKVTILQFLNRGELPAAKDIMVGLVFGIVFGFLDNFGLWMGIDSLEKYMPGGVLTKSALGNTYSDFIGAIAGSFISIMAVDIFEFDEDNSPIWLNTFGIVLGCFIGMYAGKLLTGKS